jgi:hypothetical protein
MEMRTTTMTGGRLRFIRASSAALAAACLLVGITAAPAARGWTDSEIEDSFVLSQPSVVIDGAGRGHVAYARTGAEPGILLATDAWGASPSSERISTGVDDGPSLAVDGSGHLHLAFVRYDGEPGIYYGTNASGSWVLERATSDVGSYPSLALDSADKASIAYVSDSFSPGVYHLTNASGTWASTQVTTAAHEGTVSIGIDAEDTIRIAFSRYAPEGYGIFMRSRTKTGTTWTETRISSGSDQAPALAIDGANAVHVAWQRYTGSPGVYYATNKSGGFVTSQVTDWGLDSQPAISLNPAGDPYIALRRSDADSSYTDQIAVFRLDPSWGWSKDVWGSGGLDDGWPSLSVTAAGEIVYVFGRLAGPDVGIHGWWAGKSAPFIAASEINALPDMELDASGREHLAYARSGGAAESGIRYGLRDGDTWALDDVASTTQDTWPRIAVSGPGTPHVLKAYAELRFERSVASYVPSGDSWAAETTTEGAVADIAVRTTDAHLASEGSANPIFYASSLSGWGGQFISTEPFDRFPSIAVDSNSKAHIVYREDPGVADEDAGPDLNYVTNATGAWVTRRIAYTTVWGRPAIAVDAANKVHIAFRDGTWGGISYASNATGAWVVTRVTRSWADGNPSIALDAAGKVYIAVPRFYWAANPGLYLVTNRTGSWVQSLLSDRYDVENASIDVTGGGEIRIVYEWYWEALRLLEETGAGITTTGQTDTGRSQSRASVADPRRLGQPTLDASGTQPPVKAVGRGSAGAAPRQAGAGGG